MYVIMLHFLLCLLWGDHKNSPLLNWGGVIIIIQEEHLFHGQLTHQIEANLIFFQQVRIKVTDFSTQTEDDMLKMWDSQGSSVAWLYDSHHGLIS